MKDSPFALPGLNGINQRTVLTGIRELVHRSPDTSPAMESKVDVDMVAELLSRFPSVCPPEGTSHDEMCRKQGEQRVINLLLRAYYEQNPEVQ